MAHRVFSGGNEGPAPVGEFPEGDVYRRFVNKRQARGRVWLSLFMAATLVGIIALIGLLLTVVNDAFGYIALQNKIDPETLVLNYHKDRMLAMPSTRNSEDDAELVAGVAPRDQAIGFFGYGVYKQAESDLREVFGADLATQSLETLTGILTENLSAGRVRALEAARPLGERSSEELQQLIQDEVVKPSISKSWTLLESLLHRREIIAEVAQMPNAELKFYSWVNWNFLTSAQSPQPEKAGIRVAILGSIWITILAMLIAVPIGIGAAIYLEEFAGKSRFDQLIETNINNLAGVPSIIYGMLGLAVFVRLFSELTSGSLFGVGDPTTSNGRTILSGALTLALLVLPLIIINGREAIRAVPRSLREASLGVGATQLQTVWYHVLPSALPGILTGTILALGRVLGETAPLIVVGVSTYIVVNPKTPFDKFTTLPAQIYQWTSRPQPEFQHLAAAAILVLLVLLLALNATAILLRNRYSSRRSP